MLCTDMKAVLAVLALTVAVAHGQVYWCVRPADCVSRVARGGRAAAACAAHPCGRVGFWSG